MNELREKACSGNHNRNLPDWSRRRFCGTSRFSPRILFSFEPHGRSKDSCSLFFSFLICGPGGVFVCSARRLTQTAIRTQGTILSSTAAWNNGLVAPDGGGFIAALIQFSLRYGKNLLLPFPGKLTFSADGQPNKERNSSFEVRKVPPTPFVTAARSGAEKFKSRKSQWSTKNHHSLEDVTWQLYCNTRKRRFNITFRISFWRWHWGLASRLQVRKMHDNESRVSSTMPEKKFMLHNTRSTNPLCSNIYEGDQITTKRLLVLSRDSRQNYDLYRAFYPPHVRATPWAKALALWSECEGWSKNDITKPCYSRIKMIDSLRILDICDFIPSH